MKNHKPAFFLLTITAIGFAMGGCSWFHPHHHPPKSSFKIIEQGDRNPFIIDTPTEVEDTPTRKVEVETEPVQQ